MAFARPSSPAEASIPPWDWLELCVHEREAILPGNVWLPANAGLMCLPLLLQSGERFWSLGDAARPAKKSGRGSLHHAHRHVAAPGSRSALGGLRVRCASSSAQPRLSMHLLLRGFHRCAPSLTPWVKGNHILNERVFRRTRLRLPDHQQALSAAWAGARSSTATDRFCTMASTRRGHCFRWQWSPPPRALIYASTTCPFASPQRASLLRWFSRSGVCATLAARHEALIRRLVGSSRFGGL
jgi:hypothetical protein